MSFYFSFFFLKLATLIIDPVFCFVLFCFVFIKLIW